MPHLLVFEGSYFSPSDEAAFHSWLTSVPGVLRVRGEPRGLVVTMRSNRLSEVALRELLALHHRYGLPMKDLATFQNERNASWFCDPNTYWHEKVFGESAVPADIDTMLVQLKAEGVSPVAAIKAMKRRYPISLGEAKRRLSISAAWRTHVRASASLQEDAIRVVDAEGRRDGAT